MRIAILGDGAMGSLFGGYLSRKNDVTIIGRNKEHAKTFRDGLHIVEADHEETFHPSYSTDISGMKPVDLAILVVPMEHVVIGTTRKLMSRDFHHSN